MRSKTRPSLAYILAVGIGCALFFPNRALPQAPYYEGKTITIVRGGDAGGVGDMQARALIPYLKKYIPGQPNIIIQNMPGAAGRKAANYIYSTAKPDGLSIGAVGAPAPIRD